MPILETCSWSDPGRNAFKGDMKRAVMRYKDIPEADRIVLANMVEANAYTDIVTADSTTMRSERHGYVNLRQMYFGRYHRCETVTRDEWPLGHMERGMVFTHNGHSIVRWSVCNNISRVDQVPLAAVTEFKEKPNLATLEAMLEKQGPARAVPEPGSLVLVGVGLVCAILVRRHRLR
jgi:hypothetical protein